MNDLGGPPEGGTPNMDAPMAAEDCVSLASLAMPDEEQGDQMANPEVGDKVNYMVDGTVTRIEGDNAYVKREAVNGKPVEEESAAEDQTPGEEPDAEGVALRDEASNMGALS